MNVKDKLNSFSRKVMDEATEKNLRMIEELDKQLQDELERIKASEQQRADDELKAAVAAAQDAMNRELATASLEMRKKLLARRSDMINELFDGIEQGLSEYTQSADYAGYLLRETAKIAEPGLTIRLRPADAAHAQAIAEATGLAVEVGAEDFLGGFIAAKGRGILDHSFRARLMLEREGFNKLAVK